MPHGRVLGRLGKIPPAAQRATDQWFITDAAAEAITWLATRTVEVGQDLLNWFIDLLKGAVAPIHLAVDGFKWLEIRGEANLVAANLTDRTCRSTTRSGPAAPATRTTPRSLPRPGLRKRIGPGRAG